MMMCSSELINLVYSYQLYYFAHIICCSHVHSSSTCICSSSWEGDKCETKRTKNDVEDEFQSDSSTSVSRSSELPVLVIVGICAAAFLACVSAVVGCKICVFDASKNDKL